jgi:hypothetical protein
MKFDFDSSFVVVAMNWKCKLYLFLTTEINITITILDIIHLLFKTHLNSIGLSVPHRKHITSPLRAQEVNAIYRFVTMVY